MQSGFLRGKSVVQRSNGTLVVNYFSCFYQNSQDTEWQVGGEGH